MSCDIFLSLIFSVSLSSGTPDAINVADDQLTNEQLTTQTVFGFGDYITTIGNTVMLFTPQGGQKTNFSASHYF